MRGWADRALVLSLSLLSLVCFTKAACNDTLTDVHGTVYATIELGSQCWMQSNLNVTETPTGAALERRCGSATTHPYSAINAYCGSGGFYTWETAMGGNTDFYPVPTHPVIQGICPSGWHIPSIYEWQALFNQFSLSSKRLQAAGNACDERSQGCYLTGESGFNALLTGYFSQYHNLTVTESDENRSSYFWSSTREFNFKPTNPRVQYVRLAFDHHNAFSEVSGPNDWYSVRCIKDDE